MWWEAGKPTIGYPPRASPVFYLLVHKKGNHYHESYEQNKVEYREVSSRGRCNDMWKVRKWLRYGISFWSQYINDLGINISGPVSGYCKN
jgi:hypothetical protein